MRYLRSAALAFLLTAQGAWAGVIATVPAGSGREQNTLTDLVSQNGYHYAYLVVREGKEVWIKDGRKIFSGRPGSFTSQKDKDGKSKIIAALSSDGGRLAAVQRVFNDDGSPRSFAIWVNGKTGIEHEGIHELAFSPDGSRLAYSALRGGQWRVIEGAVEGPALPGPPTNIIFRPTGGQIAYFAGQHLFLNHKPIKSWSGKKVVFSPDWLKLASMDESLKYITLDDENKFGPYSFLQDPLFSPDGRRLVYSAGMYPAQVYVDGKEIGPPLDGAQTRIYFSPQGRIYWFAKRHKAARAEFFVDGESKASWPYAPNGLPQIAFSPSGAHYAYAPFEKKQYFAVDGHAQETGYFRFYPGAGFVFDNENEFHYLELSEDEISLVCVGISKALDASNSACLRKAKKIYRLPE